MHVVGEVVEVFERAGARHFKVALRSCCIDISVPDGRDLHLGDRVVLDADLSVKSFGPHVEHGDPRAGRMHG